MTKYTDTKYPGRQRPTDVVVAGTDWVRDPDPEYICPHCRRTLSRIVDSSGENINYYCPFDKIVSHPDLEESARTKTKLKIPKGKITEVAVGYAPEPGLKRKNKEPKGTFKKLQERGIKIHNYKETGWRKENEE